MDYVAFPLRIEKATGRLARSSGAEENLLRLLKIMLSTSARGWAGSENFGMRDALPEILLKANARLETARRMNEGLRELGIDWVEVRKIEVDAASQTYEPVYLVTLFSKAKGIEVQRIDPWESRK